MTIYLASDHAGYKLKTFVKEYLLKKGYSIKDEGAFSEERANWAEYGARAAQAVSEDPENSVGIIICGSGIGMSMVSNKFRNVRAALCNDEYSAEMSRKHNNANVLNMGARLITAELAIKIVDVWMNTDFEGGRHSERLAFMSEVVEEKNFK